MYQFNEKEVVGFFNCLQRILQTKFGPWYWNFTINILPQYFYKNAKYNTWYWDFTINILPQYFYKDAKYIVLGIGILQ